VRPLTAILVGVALVFSACGDDDDDTEQPAAQSTPAAEA
jgi:hypothetical protein